MQPRSKTSCATMKTQCRQTNIKKSKEARVSACSWASSGCFPTPLKGVAGKASGILASACPHGDPVRNPSLPCTTAEKLLEQRSQHPGGRKETKSRPPEATAASPLAQRHPPPRPRLPPGLLPQPTGRGPTALRGQRAPWAEAGQPVAHPGPVSSGPGTKGFHGV